MSINSLNNRYTGDGAYLSFAGVEIQVNMRDFQMDDQYDMADSTAGSDVDKTHILTLRDVSFSLPILETIGEAGSAYRTAIKNGAEGTMVFGPEGTVAGKPKYSCLASVTGIQRTYPYSDVVQANVTLQRQGSWIENYEDAGDTF